MTLRTPISGLVVLATVFIVACSAAEPPDDPGQDIDADVPELDAGTGDGDAASDDTDSASDTSTDTNADDVDDDRADVLLDSGPSHDAHTDADDPDPLYIPGELPDGAANLLLGTGDQGYEPLFQGDTLTWEQGMQGGFHIWGSFHAEGPPFDGLSDEALWNIFQDYSLFDDQGDLVATTNRFGFVDAVEGGVEGGGFTVILRRTLSPQDMVGGPFEFVLTVTLDTGEEFVSRAWIYLECCDFL